MEPWLQRIDQISCDSVGSDAPISTQLTKGQEDLDFPDKAMLHSLSDSTASSAGVRPISFSFPTGLMVSHLPNKSQTVSEIRPGAPYGFTDQGSYYEDYKQSIFSLTHRKAGWDCFRHVEILGKGSIPIMPDVDLIPIHTMMHYPKSAMSQIASSLLVEDVVPTASTQDAFLDFTRSTLSTVAMSQYVVEVAQLSGAGSALFVDEAVSSAPDYLSLLALIGFKELPGPKCHSWFPVDYLYRDFNGDPSNLYGRGLGYGKLLPTDLKSVSNLGTSRAELKRVLHSDLFDIVVVGSAPRNQRLTGFILNHFPSRQVVLLDGEDRPPRPSLLNAYCALDSNVFVRELVL